MFDLCFLCVFSTLIMDDLVLLYVNFFLCTINTNFLSAALITCGHRTQTISSTYARLLTLFFLMAHLALHGFFYSNVVSVVAIALWFVFKFKNIKVRQVPSAQTFRLFGTHNN